MRNVEIIFKERKAENVSAEIEKEKGKYVKNKCKGDTEKEDVLYPVCVKRGSIVEALAIDYPKTRILEAEPQKPHLTFLLMNEENHDKIWRRFPEELGELEKKKMKVKTK